MIKIKDLLFVLLLFTFAHLPSVFCYILNTLQLRTDTPLVATAADAADSITLHHESP